jgi:hypothetical protein
MIVKKMTSAAMVLKLILILTYVCITFTLSQCSQNQFL